MAIFVTTVGALYTFRSNVEIRKNLASRRHCVNLRSKQEKEGDFNSELTDCFGGLSVIAEQPLFACERLGLGRTALL